MRWARGCITKWDGTSAPWGSPTQASCRRRAGASAELHIRAWRIATLYRLGRWDEAIAEYSVLRRILDDREDDPPYFAMHAFGAVGVIYERRAERVQSDGLAGAMMRMVTGSSGRLYPSLLRFLVVQRRPRQAEDIRRPAELGGPRGRVRWRPSRNDSPRQRSGTERRTSSPRCGATRRRADAPAVVAFADRLEGRAAVAAGDAAERSRSLERAADGVRDPRCPLGASAHRARPRSRHVERGQRRRRRATGRRERRRRSSSWETRRALAAARALTESG